MMVPAEAETPEISVPATLTGSKLRRLDDHAIQTAMDEVGLTRVSVKKWKAQHTIGQALEEIGAVHVCAGEYVISNHLRMEAVELLASRMREAGVTFEQLALMAKVMNDILTARDAATSSLLRSVQAGLVKDTPETSTGASMPPKGSKIIAVQINQTVTPQQKSA